MSLIKLRTDQPLVADDLSSTYRQTQGQLIAGGGATLFASDAAITTAKLARAYQTVNFQFHVPASRYAGWAASATYPIALVALPLETIAYAATAYGYYISDMGGAAGNTWVLKCGSLNGTTWTNESTIVSFSPTGTAQGAVQTATIINPTVAFNASSGTARVVGLFLTVTDTAALSATGTDQMTVSLTATRLLRT